MPDKIDFLTVTELSGDEVTQEQVDRICNRYFWAGEYCNGKDVLEVACGTGQGMGYIDSLAKTFVAGDFSKEILAKAQQHYESRIKLSRFDAQQMPFPDHSLDVVILFEAIYYLPSAERFINECTRILRKNGTILISTSNKDLFDFNPSPYSFVYYGVEEFGKLFKEAGYTTSFFGNTPVDSLSFRQKIFRPIKKLAVTYHLVPGSMQGKKLLKKLVFGEMVSMPAEINASTAKYVKPSQLITDTADKRHKVIYCAAARTV
jgi:SAM-dependent methyltransferase